MNSFKSYNGLFTTAIIDELMGLRFFCIEEYKRSKMGSVHIDAIPIPIHST